MTTLQLDQEIARQLGLISGNVDLKKKVLDYLKGLTAQLKPVKKRKQIRNGRQYSSPVRRLLGWRSRR